MSPRLELSDNQMFTKAAKHLVAANAVVSASSIPVTTQLLVTLRASQINGCGPCVEMHTDEALRVGEDQHRLTLVVAWREATVFSDAERAALELAEQGTRIADADRRRHRRQRGRTPRSTTTTTSSVPWSRSSRSSTPSTAST